MIVARESKSDPIAKPAHPCLPRHDSHSYHPSSWYQFPALVTFLMTATKACDRNNFEEEGLFWFTLHEGTQGLER